MKEIKVGGYYAQDSSFIDYGKSIGVELKFLKDLRQSSYSISLVLVNQKITN